MSINLQRILKSKAINEWRLFWLIAAPMSAIILVELMGTDLSTGDGVSHMIGYSVRFAVPLIFLVVAASSVQILFPGPFPMWWVRNRKYIGLSFAVAMAWQGLFIFIMSNFFRDYYYEDVYLLRDELEGSIGYIFLPAMVITSFHFGRKYLTSQQWKILHKSAIYFLFAYPFSTYWWTLAHYYGEPGPLDFVYYWMGFLAFTARIAAWGKQREDQTSVHLKALGGIIIAFGLVVSAYGHYLQEPITAFLTGSQWSADFGLWFPFWPFEPFLSLFIIALGTMLYTRAKA